jgi:ApbE superfamily uncharacterized protein (UPF0280 family)
MPYLNDNTNNFKPGKGFEPRFYRNAMGAKRFKSFVVTYKDSDLWIGIDNDSFRDEMVGFAHEKLISLRDELELYIAKHPGFAESFEPLNVLPNAPGIALEMANAAKIAKTGPMAAVAGAFSENIGLALQRKFNIKEIAVENGGDIYLSVQNNIVISVYAGESALSNKVGIDVRAVDTPLGICTSAGTVGPSVSLGKADAVVLACKNTALADAYATFVANNVNTNDDIERALSIAQSNKEILSLLVICNGEMGIWGKFELKLLK